MTKRLVSVLLALMLCVGLLGGCKKNVGTSEDNAIKEEDEEEQGEVESFQFGFSCITMDNPYFITLEQA